MTSNRPIYSFEMGMEVYKEFQACYERATKIFQLITNHDVFYPVNLFCHNQPKWERYKKYIKFIEKEDITNGTPMLGKHLCSYYKEKLNEYVGENTF